MEKSTITYKKKIKRRVLFCPETREKDVAPKQTTYAYKFCHYTAIIFKIYEN